MAYSFSEIVRKIIKSIRTNKVFLFVQIQMAYRKIKKFVKELVVSTNIVNIIKKILSKPESVK